MSQILAMTRKEFFLWARKPGSWIIVFVIPFLFIWIVQAVFGSSGTPVVSIFVVNEDESQASQYVMQVLKDAPNLRVQTLETRGEADRLVGTGERLAAVVIPEGFGSRLKMPAGADIDIIIDPARAEQAAIVVGLVNSALGPFIIDAEVTRSVEAGVNQVLGGVIYLPNIISDSKPEATLTPETELTATVSAYPETSAEIDNEADFPPVLAQEPTIEPTSKSISPANDPLRIFLISAIKGVVAGQVQEALDNPQVRLAVLPLEGSKRQRSPSLLDNLVPGYSLMFMYFLVSNLAITVVEERQTGTLRRLLSAPVPRSRILFGKMLPYFLIGAVQMSAVLLFSQLIFGFDLGERSNGARIAIALVILCSALAMSGLGIFIAALAQTEGQANGLAIIIILALAVISGAMFPIIYIPGLQLITPHYWSMQAFLNIIVRGQGIDGILLPAGILLIMSIVFFTLGAIKFRFE